MTQAAILPLVVRDLCYEIGGKRLLDGICFRTDAGPRTMVLGPNGAGKSLLLRLCHGLLQPSAGTMTWAGAAPETARHCQAMVFQRPVLLRRSTAANITYVLRLQGIPRRQRRAVMTEMLEQAALLPLATRPARVLSGGEQQRLALVRAWALRPQVLFLDEPTASLDPAATRAVEVLLEHIHHTGTKIIMIFLLAGGLALASLAAMPGLPREIGRGVGHGPVVAGLRGSGLVGPGLAFAATTVAAGVVVTFLPLAVSERQQGLAALALFAQAASAPAARWAAGRYADRHGPAGLLVPALALTAIGAATLVEIANPVLALAGMLVFGAGFGAAQTATLALMLERVPATEYARVSALWNVAYDAGWGAGAAGFGLAVGTTGYGFAFGLTALVLVGTLLAACGGPAALRGPARRQDLLDQLQQPHRAEGLDQELRVRDALHRVAVGRARRRGQHDDGDLRAELHGAHALEHLQPVHDRHHQVEQDQVGLQPLDRLDRLLPVARLVEVVGPDLQDAADELPQRRLVVADQDRPSLRHGARG